ncbi:hypothetical protein YC2023_074669 [Brassica napus]
MKGKGILYEDDDAPIKLVDSETSFVIKEFNMTLIGKILNPKKQNVEKLLQKMPSQWGLSERITANDIGNGKFLFNFMNEEDLNFVLRQGPFHFNFCMFVLVRWEPIVHDDYPWIVPFWVQLVGFPLHLWTDGNLRNIGGRLGHVDTLELTEGRMLIDIDSRKPLKFSRKVEYKGDEVTLEIKYDKLFKHCSTCGMLTHEKDYCPTTDVRTRIQPMERRDVFSRVQTPQEQNARQHLNRNVQAESHRSSQSSMDRDRPLAHISTPHNPRFNDRYHYNENDVDDRGNQREERGLQSRSWYDNRWNGNDGRKGHADRIIRRRDEHPRSSRYRGSRSGTGPYDRPQRPVWRAKPKSRVTGKDDAVVSYEQSSRSLALVIHNSEDNKCSGSQGTRKIASAIVTPSRLDRPMEDNVTVRNKGEGRALAFSPFDGQDPPNRVVVSDVRPARERACRCGSPLIFHQVLFFGFSYLSSPYRLVGALVRALSVVVTSGGDPVEALCLEQRREWVEDGGGEAVSSDVGLVWPVELSSEDDRRSPVNRCLEGVSGEDGGAIELVGVPVVRSWEMAPGSRLLRFPAWFEAVERE